MEKITGIYRMLDLLLNTTAGAVKVPILITTKNMMRVDVEKILRHNYRKEEIFFMDLPCSLNIDDPLKGKLYREITIRLPFNKRDAEMLEEKASVTGNYYNFIASQNDSSEYSIYHDESEGFGFYTNASWRNLRFVDMVDFLKREVNFKTNLKKITKVHSTKKQTG